MLEEFINFISNGFVSLAAVQLVGVAILITSRMSDTEIKFISGTYYDYNKYIIEQLVAARFDQWLGLLTVVIPTVLSALNDVPFYFSYISLFIALAFRFLFIRSCYINKYMQKIIEMHEGANAK